MLELQGRAGRRGGRTQSRTWGRCELWRVDARTMEKPEVSVSVPATQGSRNQLSQTRWLPTAEVDFLTVPETRSPTSVSRG